MNASATHRAATLDRAKAFRDAASSALHNGTAPLDDSDQNEAMFNCLSALVSGLSATIEALQTLCEEQNEAHSVCRWAESTYSTSALGCK